MISELQNMHVIWLGIDKLPEPSIPELLKPAEESEPQYVEYTSENLPAKGTKVFVSKDKKDWHPYYFCFFNEENTLYPFVCVERYETLDHSVATGRGWAFMRSCEAIK